MKKLAIVSDIHGCIETLLALVEKIPSDYEIVLAGDMIDRGPHSKEVVEWAMNGHICCVLGNHEDMMLYHHRLFHRGMPYHDRNIWLNNGGSITLESWGGSIPPDVLVWADRLPFFIREGEFEISHTGWGGFEKACREVRLWMRHGSEAVLKSNDGIYRVFGHTQKEEPWIEPTFAMIDTGCAYKDRGMGNLTAFLIPDKTIIQQRCLD